MCTVTVVPHDRGVRVMSNRDELRTRPAALAPRLHRLDGRLAAFPVDPQGGGTWIGVNDAGLIVALLNRNRPPVAATVARTRSRGLIVCDLLRCGSVSDALARAARLDAAAFEPFRAITVQGLSLGVATSDGSRIACVSAALGAPRMFTSSSLGDDVVEHPRRRLFERIVLQRHRAALHGQARFHRHQWPHRPEVSVRMQRQHAVTVSHTVVDVAIHGAGLLYQPTADGRFQHEAREWCSLR